MDWDRIEAARRQARFMLAIPWVGLAILAFAGVEGEIFGGGLHGISLSAWISNPRVFAISPFQG